MLSLICTMHLIVCEATGSSEQVDFSACVRSLTWLERMGSFPPTLSALAIATNPLRQLSTGNAYVALEHFCIFRCKR